MARTSTSARPLTDHDEIRRWAEERGAKPACVTGTGGGDDVGMIRLDFPGYSGADSLEEISWDEWFDKFDESNLALLVQDETAKGQQSNFSKLVKRETAAQSGARGRTQRSSRQRASANGSDQSGSQRSRGQARLQASGTSRSSGRGAFRSRATNSARNSSGSRRSNGGASGRRAPSRTTQGRRGPQKARRAESRRRAA